MATYSLQGPDGRTYSVEGPAGATRQQVIAEIERQNGGPIRAPSQVGSRYRQLEPPPWEDYAPQQSGPWEDYAPQESEPSRTQLLAEAHRRGLLPPEQKAAYEEAQRRGMIPARQESDPWAVKSVEPDPYAGIGRPVSGPGMFDDLIPKPRRSLTRDAAGFLANVNRGLGVGDEIAAGLKTGANLLSGRASLGDIPGAYRNALADQRALEGDYMGAHRSAANLARGVGMAPATFAPMGGQVNAFANASRLGNALRGAATAGLSGAAYSAVDAGTPGERLRAASATATNPIVLGLGAAGGSIGPRARTAKPKPVSVDQLRAQKTAAYRAVDEMGVAYSPRAASDLAQGISDELTAANISATRHPRAFSMMQDIRARLGSGRPVRMSELDQLRQEIYRDVAGPRADEAERFFGQKIIDNIDEFIDAAGPGQVVAGNARGAAEALARARDLNKRYRKVQTVQSALDSAELGAASTYSGGNVNNATRQKLRPFIDPQSGRRIRNLTPDEEAALNVAVRGTPGQNVARQIGKLSPQGNGLMMAGQLATLLPSGGLSGVAALVGAASKHIADRGTARNVERLLQLMASGGNQTAVNAERELARMAARNPQVARAYAEMRATLARASGVGGGARQPSVEVQVEGRPDLGYGAAYGPASAMSGR